LVSFFFTPIYMFTLVFLVMFGFKKGSNLVYKPNWSFRFKEQLKTIKTLSIKDYYYMFQFTVITSRLTSYFLFSFWLFFFFFGEVLLLFVFNYSSTCESINSSSFVNIKQHIIFYIITIPSKLSFFINKYIFFLTSCSILYMINFNYAYSYRYLSMSYVNNNLALITFLLTFVYSFLL
jgi:hypothetical protein